MLSQKTIRLALLLLVCWGSEVSLAQQPARIDDLSDVDIPFLTQQREIIQQLALTNLGRSFAGDRDRDLDLLQALLDQQVVLPGQIRKLQAMGVIMGDLLADELDMHWVVYEDDIGRSRALQWRESDNIVFPMTMISRRREAGNETSMFDIYQKVSSTMAARTAALPFP